MTQFVQHGDGRNRSVLGKSLHKREDESSIIDRLPSSSSDRPTGLSSSSSIEGGNSRESKRNLQSQVRLTTTNQEHSKNKGHTFEQTDTDSSEARRRKEYHGDIIVDLDGVIQELVDFLNHVQINREKYEHSLCDQQKRLDLLLKQLELSLQECIQFHRLKLARGDTLKQQENRLASLLREQTHRKLSLSYRDKIRRRNSWSDLHNNRKNVDETGSSNIVSFNDDALCFPDAPRTTRRDQILNSSKGDKKEFILPVLSRKCSIYQSQKMARLRSQKELLSLKNTPKRRLVDYTKVRGNGERIEPQTNVPVDFTPSKNAYGLPTCYTLDQSVYEIIRKGCSTTQSNTADKKEEAVKEDIEFLFKVKSLQQKRKTLPLLCVSPKADSRKSLVKNMLTNVDRSRAAHAEFALSSIVKNGSSNHGNLLTKRQRDRKTPDQTEKRTTGKPGDVG